MLLEHHADIHVRNARGEVALHFAACHYEYPFQVHIRRLLLDHGADVNARDEDGSTPLHHPSFRRPDPSDPGWCSVEGTQLLLEHGANIEQKTTRVKLRSWCIGSRVPRHGRGSMGPWHHVNMLNIHGTAFRTARVPLRVFIVVVIAH